MPRTYNRKTGIGLHTADQMQKAIQLVKEGNKIRSVAKLTGIPYTTLYRYNKKKTDNPSHARFVPNYAVNKIFSAEQEQSLVDYVLQCSKMFYGLTPLEVRQLAYQVANANFIKVPENWNKMEAAGIDWLYGFRKRHTVLSLRTPEGCSLSRATSFNRHNVDLFFDNLQEVMVRNENFGNGTRIYNLDETNTVTVQKSGKVLAPRGQKQVSKVTSAEKGTLVTTCYIINATGYALPPVMIFPRVHFKNHMIAGSPAGTLGLANQSGWMNTDLFVATMKHFISKTQSSKDNPSLLIMDNYEAHISLQALNLAKENGVTVLTVPPHSTGKLQPLDVAIFKPFKTAYNAAVDSWMMRNAGKTFSIYEVAQCVKEAHIRAMTPANICSAFEATGIFPYNRNIFTDLDFAPSEVTNRPLQENAYAPIAEQCRAPEVSIPVVVTTNSAREVPETMNNEDSVLDQIHTALDPLTDILATNSTSELPENSNSSVSEQEHVPPGLLPALVATSPPECPEIRNSPGNIPLDVSMSAVITNTIPPVQDYSSNFLQTTPRKEDQESSQIASVSSPIPQTSTEFISPFQLRGLPKAGPRQTTRKPRRKGKSMIATDTPNKDEIESRELTKICKKSKTAKSTKRKIMQSDSSDEEAEKVSIYSEEEGSFGDDDDTGEDCIDPKNFGTITNTPQEGTYVLVVFKIHQRKNVYYVAKVLREINSEVEVSFLRKCTKQSNTFRSPNVPDIAVVPLRDVKMILSKPSFSGQTKRQQGFYIFNYDFSRIDIR